MSQPSEVVFALQNGSEACVFTYEHGPLRLKAPRKRGRPKGSVKLVRPETQLQHDDFSFDFINYTQDRRDAASRRTIRRRGMLLHLREKRQKMLGSRQHKIAPLVSLGGVDPFDAVPLKMEPYMHDLLKYCCTSIWKDFYRLEHKAGINLMSDFWMPLAFHDIALLHAFIAFSGHYASQTSPTDRRPSIIHHMQKAISQANTRMAKPEAVSTEMLVVIALIAIIQNSHGANENWKHSMQGLRNLINFTGVRLEQKPLILGAIYRADLSGSIDTAQTPYFADHFTLSKDPDFIPLSSGFAQFECENVLDCRIKYNIQRIHSTLIATCRQDARDMAQVANCRFIFTACQYELLSFTCATLPDELCRVSLLMYILAVMDERPRTEMAYECLLLKFQCLWRLVKQGLLTSQFKLWSLSVAITITRHCEILDWCLFESSMVLNNLGISTFDAFHDTLQDFLPVCDFRSRDVWGQHDGWRHR